MSAFVGTGLTSVTLPASLESIGEYAFRHCANLTSVTLPAGLTSADLSAAVNLTTIENYAFANTGLTSANLSAAVKLTSIGVGTFEGCTGLESVTLPGSLTTIENNAFADTGLISIELPASLASIASKAFEGCSSLTSITVAEDNENFTAADGVLFNRDKTELLRYPEGKVGAPYAVPGTVTAIGTSAFFGCSRLISVTLPASLESIGVSAFWGCSGLTNIDLSAASGLTSIGSGAFDSCSSLTSIDLPAGLTSIELPAFGGCSSLTSITVAEGNEKFTAADGVLFELNGDKTTLFRYPEGKGVTFYTVPGDVTAIGERAFEDCKALTSLTLLSEEPPTLGGNALSGTNALQEILVPADAVDAYKAAAGWSTYTGKIIANPDTSTTYAVTVQIEGSGTASASPTSAAQGTEITLTANPNTGYHLARWEIVAGDITITNGQFTMPASDVAVRAVFAPHSSTGGWQSDASSHWKKCDFCKEKFQEGTHTAAPDDGDCTTAVTCSVCGYTMTPGQKAHSYQWESNRDGTHTGRCTNSGCVQQRADQPCDYDENGKCIVCGYERITITAQPQSVTVTEGGAAAFRVAAAGSYIASYQWQASADGGATWADVDGATGDSYTIPAAALDMDGRQYRCVVSNSGDSATSAAATLTVARRNDHRPAAPLRDIAVEAGPGGTVEVWPERAAMSTTVTVTATPDEGYAVEAVTVTAGNGDELTVTEKAGNQYTFRMPGGEVTVAVTFRPLPDSGADTPAGHPFADVPEGHWAYDAVRYVYGKGLMAGVSDTLFAPAQGMSRAMAWAVLARLDGQAASGPAWAEEARAWAVSQGVSDGADPQGAITREQLAAMLYRYAGSPAVNVPELALVSAYPDGGAVSPWAQEALAWAIGQGVVEGREGLLAPGEGVTRAEAAAMLARLCQAA